LVELKKIAVAIVGSGNIGIDLMKKIIKKSEYMELKMVAGIDKNSEGLRMAAEKGIAVSYEGVDPVLADGEIRIVFECTSAKAHLENAPKYKAAGKTAVDLTPAAVGPYVVPVINIDDHLDRDNINMVTCGGQATVPIVHAVNSVCKVNYAEIVSTISSKSAGPGTRENIDEFTETTANALEVVGGADRGKAIIILNPAEPPIMMRNTIYCRIDAGKSDGAAEKIADAVKKRVEEIRKYVPGYELIVPPILDGDKVTIMIQVEGSGDYLPKYSGNLDIITCAAMEAGDRIAFRLLKGNRDADRKAGDRA